MVRFCSNVNIRSDNGSFFYWDLEDPILWVLEELFFIQKFDKENILSLYFQIM